MHGSLQRFRVQRALVRDFSRRRALFSSRASLSKKLRLKRLHPASLIRESWKSRNRVLKIPATFDLHFKWMKKIVTIIKPFREIAYRQSCIYPCCASHNSDKVAINCLEKEKEKNDKARRE